MGFIFPVLLTRTQTQTDILANDQFNSFIRILQSFANTIMAISASRYTVRIGFKGVLLVYVEGILLYICCLVTENYSTKFLELKQRKKKNSIFPNLNPPKSHRIDSVEMHCHGCGDMA